MKVSIVEEVPGGPKAERYFLSYVHDRSYTLENATAQTNAIIAAGRKYFPSYEEAKAFCITQGWDFVLDRFEL